MLLRGSLLACAEAKTINSNYDDTFVCSRTLLAVSRAMYRRTLVRFICFVAILTLSIGANAQDSAQNADANRARARQFWEEAIRAKGGRDRLHSVQTVLISSTVKVEAPRGGGYTETERLYALPGKAWLYEFTPDFDVTVDATVINVERNLCMVTLSPARGDVPPISACVPTTWAELIRDPIIYLMETQWVRPEPVRTRTEGKGKKQVDVIETEVGNLRIDFYLDRKTRLPFKLVTDDYYGVIEATHRMGLTVKLDDYVTIDGIQMPGSVIREPQANRDRRDTEYAKYKFNVAHDPRIFEHPISRKVKRHDWKLRS